LAILFDSICLTSKENRNKVWVGDEKQRIKKMYESLSSFYNLWGIEDLMSFVKEKLLYFSPLPN
jgi:hypothetical protein